jgi:rsbT co-antagonist protein RsbR
MPPQSNLSAVLRKRRDTIMAQWTQEQQREIGAARARLSQEEITRQSSQFLDLLVQAAQRGSVEDITGADWKEIRDFLDGLSRERVLSGFASDETATFIFSLKRPIFDALREESNGDANKLAADVWTATVLLDKLGLHTVKSFQRTREEVISRQQQELLELSTPVVKLWDGILALPMIGTLDSARTQVVMESLLQKIVETESQIAIVDITGVPTVDTLVAQHLLKTVTALRLMGADCIISGVRPQIAQTIVHLGVDLQGVTTKANLADALALALRRSGIEFKKQ